MTSLPSYRADTPTISLQHFDIVGQDSKEAGLVAHAGLARSAGAQPAAQIPVIDMGPPLHAEGGNVRANVVGSAILTDDEVQKIRTFIDRHALEHLVFAKLGRRQTIKLAPQMYCIYPHASPYREDDGRYARTRFSCAGFIFEAYKNARIGLLNIGALPSVEVSEIRSAYHDQMGLLEGEGVALDALGLEGVGPWQVMFCGYLFHALNREAGVIRNDPFAPGLPDRYFR